MKRHEYQDITGIDRSRACYRSHVEHALGTPQRPMSDSDLETKFRSLTTGILSEQQASALFTACWDMEKLENVAEIARLAVPS